MKILGIAVSQFTTGPDGGRDAFFSGTAIEYPSSAKPASGKFVIQAKHTEDPSASFSDKDFSSDAESSTISKEIEKIKKLVAKGECDHYLLFSNRRMPGQVEEKIRNRILTETGISSVFLVCLRMIKSYLKRFPAIAEMENLNKYDTPIEADPEDIANIVLKFKDNLASISTSSIPTDIPEKRNIEEKNLINGLSPEFWNVIKKDFMEAFGDVRDFLQDPINGEFLDAYHSVITDFQTEIISNKEKFEKFDKVLQHFYKVLIKSDPDLRDNKMLTRTFLYYMYWNCDIGQNEYAEAQ